jgi:acetyl-CoA C-acetyltransferase
MTEAWIIDACRTPRGIGKVGKGALAHMHPHHLSATVLKALAERNALDTDQVDDIVWGTSTQVGNQGGDIGRMAALDAGYSIKAAGVTLDRACGSGLTAFNLAAATLIAGQQDLVIAGGSEMMSYFPQLPKIGAGGLDKGNLRLRARHPQSHQGVCADAIASREGIDRAAVDALALLSQQRAAVAIAEGRFDRSVVPVYNEDGSLALDREEFPRPQTTAEGLAGLRPSFAEIADAPLDDTGRTFRGMINQVYPDLQIEAIHHAGNSSGVVDGAGAILMCTPDYAKARGWKPRARAVASVNAGGCPTLMLDAPVAAIEKALDRAGLTVADIDLFEINEAFAVVVEKAIRHLSLDREKVNVNGGAMALGHPIGATGNLLIGTVLDELERREGRYGLVTMCTAGGMAPAVIIERL